MDNTVIVMIHGAGLGAWIWRDVRPLLKGHSYAANFPGREPLPAPSNLVTLDDYANAVIEQIQHREKEHIILVGHSIGALVALKAAKHFGKRISGFVAIASPIPKDGGSFMSALPLGQRLMLKLALRKGTKPPDDLIRKAYCNDLKPEQAEEVVRRFVAESPHLYTDKCLATPPETRKLYIQTSIDNQLPMRYQMKMAGNLDAQEMLTIRAGHLPMLSEPKELADMLNRFIDQVASSLVKGARAHH